MFTGPFDPPRIFNEYTHHSLYQPVQLDISQVHVRFCFWQGIMLHVKVRGVYS